MQEDKNKKFDLSLPKMASLWILRNFFPDRVWGRSPINDGLCNRVEFYVLTHFFSLWSFAQSIPLSNKFINTFLINKAANLAPHRPYQLTTRADYTTWDSLTDRSFSGRHLPPMKQEDLEFLKSVDVDQVVALFHRNGDTIESEKSSVLFSYFVQWFIDGVLVTDGEDWLKNKSNHNIDLSTLYGFCPEAACDLRSYEDGKLKSQWLKTCKGVEEEYPPFYYPAEHGCIDDGKPNQSTLFPHLGPPEPRSIEPAKLEDKLKKIFAMGKMNGNVQIGFVMMNTLFLREHNRICNKLKFGLENNLPEDWKEDWEDEKRRDERLFQTARNILSVLLLTIIIEEYINHITPYHFKFFLDSLSFMKESWYRQNWVAMEFDLLYRWHSLTPDKIALGDKEVSIKETIWETDLVVQRGLGSLFNAASSQHCGRIGLHNTLSFLIPAEKKSLEMGRAARLKSYNDYRELCKLPKVTDFDQITGDKDVQNELRDLYGHVDKIELYTGLFAEDNRPNSPLGPLMARLVAIDAFSQVITNPLLADTVFSHTKKPRVLSLREQTFTKIGCDIIDETRSLSDILHRNIPQDDRTFKVSMSFKE